MLEGSTQGLIEEWVNYWHYCVSIRGSNPLQVQFGSFCSFFGCLVVNEVVGEVKVVSP